MDLYREERFVPGLDEGLKGWAKMRQELRNARLSGYNGEMTLPRGRFRYKRYWDKKIPFKCRPEDEDWNDDDALKKPWQDEDRDFMAALENSHARHGQITDVMAMQALEMRHERHLAWLVDFIHDEGESVNQPFTHKFRTLLHIACQRGDLFKVKYLLFTAGANPNMRDANKNTALHLALKLPQRFHPLELINALMDSGANIDARNDKGQTPLHLACILGDIALMEVLLARGPSVTKKDKNKKMAIQHALVVNSLHSLNRGSVSEVRAVFHKYTKVCGHHNLQRMWARIISRNFDEQLFQIVIPNCPKCKRRVTTCGEIKRNNYRHWLLLHNQIPS